MIELFEQDIVTNDRQSSKYKVALIEDALRYFNIL